jgi:CheY-like chemotaxis protein
VDLISGADDKLLKVLRKNVSNRKYTVLEAVCMRGDESRFDAEIVVNRIRGYNSGALCFFIRDVTDRKLAEKELEQANEKLVEAEKMQARLDTLSTIYHQLNNPLQILTCLTELDDNKEYKKQLGRIVTVLDQLRKQGSLEAIVSEEGETLYDIPVERELVECDAKRILIVDDEEVLRKMFANSLSTAYPDLTIDTAGEGNEAIELFGKHRHGLVVMDVHMPVMSGEEAFEQIKELCDRKGLKLPPFIFCTGFTVSEGLKAIIGDETYHTCLAKPLTISALVEAVKKHVSA